MTRTRLGLLGLCAMVFGLMAFSTTGAHAAQWLILKEGKLVANLEATATVEKDTNGILRTHIAGLGVKFECTTVGSEGVTLAAGGTVAKGGKLVFSGCETFLTEKEKEEKLSEPCEPVAGGTEKGVIKTRPGHGVLILHELADKTKDDLLQILPDDIEGKTSETFAVIEMSTNCSIGSKVPVIGKATLKDCKGLALTHAVTHLIEAGPLTELWAISKTVEHMATIEGSGIAKLTGAHLGLLWSGDPE